MAQLGFGQRLGYALGNAGVSIAGVPGSILLLYYLTQIVGVRAGLAGLVLALPKVWDALVDPMFGGWVDRLSLRLRQRTPILLIATAGLLATLVCLFSLPQMQTVLAPLIIAIGLSIVSSVCQTALGVLQYSLATDMSRGSAQLSSLLSLASIMAQVLTVAGSAVVPLLVNWSGEDRVGYARMAGEVALIAGIALVGFALTTRRVPVRAAGTEGGGLWASLKATSKNSAFYWLMAFVILQNAGIVFLLSYFPFANQYVLNGTTQDLSILEAVVGVTVVGGMALAPRFVRRLGTVRSMRSCNLLSGAALLAMLAASYLPSWASWSAAALLGLAWGIVGILIQTAILDAARISRPGLPGVALGFYLGILMAGIKLGTSAGGFLSGEFLDLVGFRPGGEHQSAATLTGMRLGYALLPLLFVVVSDLTLRRVPGEYSMGRVVTPSTSNTTA
jgi:Na+/melibiose symporter-like transporter